MRSGVGFAARAAARERKWGRPWSVCGGGRGKGGLRHVGAMLGGIDPHCLCGRWADLYVQFSNRFSFEAKLIEQSEVEQAACTTLKSFQVVEY
jgi:hypothetical protein